MDKDVVKQARARRREDRQKKKKNAGCEKRGIRNTLAAFAAEKPKRPVH